MKRLHSSPKTSYACFFSLCLKFLMLQFLLPKRIRKNMQKEKNKILQFLVT